MSSSDFQGAKVPPTEFKGERSLAKKSMYTIQLLIDFAIRMVVTLSRELEKFESKLFWCRKVQSLKQAKNVSRQCFGQFVFMERGSCYPPCRMASWIRKCRLAFERFFVFSEPFEESSAIVTYCIQLIAFNLKPSNGLHWMVSTQLTSWWSMCNNAKSFGPRCWSQRAEYFSDPSWTVKVWSSNSAKMRNVSIALSIANQ